MRARGPAGRTRPTWSKSLSTRAVCAAVVAGALALSATACGDDDDEPSATSGSQPSGAPEVSAATKKLIKSARQEGELTLISPWAGGRDEIEAWQDGFNEKYGLDLKFTYQPGYVEPQTLGKIQTSQKAGQKSPTDVALGISQNAVVLLDESGALLPIELDASPDLKADWIQGAGDGTAVKVKTSLAGIAYNTKALQGDDVPESYEDVLSADARVAVPPYPAVYSDLATEEVWGVERTLDYAKKLAPQVDGLVGCGEEARLASGEFDILVPECAHSLVLRLEKQNAPVGFVVPKDAPILSWDWAGVPKNAANPAAAKLFINYLLTPDAQKILYEGELADFDELPGSQTADYLKELEAQGREFTGVDVEAAKRLGLEQIDAIGGQVVGLVTQSQK